MNHNASNRRRWQLTGPQLAVGLLALVVLVVSLLAVVPAWHFAVSAREDIQDLHFQLARYRAIARQKDRWLTRLETLQQQRTSGAELFSNRPTAALAAADLQQKIKETLQTFHGSLVSTQVLEAHSEEGYTRYGLSVTLSATMAGLRDILYQLEQERPVLFVRSLNLRPQFVAPRFGATNAKQPPDQLYITFELVGYLRAP